MTNTEKIEKAKSYGLSFGDVFGKDNFPLLSVTVRDEFVEIRPFDNFDATLEKLDQFSQKIGTKSINFRYDREDCGYSEYTPGSSSDLVIVCGYK